MKQTTAFLISGALLLAMTGCGNQKASGGIQISPAQLSKGDTLTITVTGLARPTFTPEATTTISNIAGQQVGADLSRLPRGLYIIQQGTQPKTILKR